MESVCLAILLMAVVAHAEPPVTGYLPTPQTTSQEHNIQLYNNPESVDFKSPTSKPYGDFRDRHIEYEATRSGSISAKPKMSKSKTIVRHYGTPVNTRTLKKPPTIARNHDINKDISGTNDGEFKGYPTSRKVKSHYERPEDQSSTERSLSSVYGTSKAKTQPLENIPRPKFLGSSYSAPLKSELNEPALVEIPRSSGVARPSNLKSPTTEYSSIRTQLSYATPKSFTTNSVNPKKSSNNYKELHSMGDTYGIQKFYDSYEVPNPKIQKSFIDSFGTPGLLTSSYGVPRSTYGTSKSMNTKYDVPKSRGNYGSAKSLVDSYDAMLLSDFTYGESRNKYNSYGSSEQMNNNYEDPETLSPDYDTPNSNIFFNSANSRITNENYGPPSVRLQMNKNLNDAFTTTTKQEYKAPKPDESHSENFGRRLIAPKHSNKANDQQYDNSNSNFEERSINYYNDDFQRTFDEYDQDYSNDDYATSFNSGPQDMYGLSKDLRSGLQGTASRSLPDSSEVSRSSPGITGVTQAIVRPNIAQSDFRQHRSKYETSSNINKQQEGVARINSGDSYQGVQRKYGNSNQQARSGKHYESAPNQAQSRNIGASEISYKSYQDYGRVEKFGGYPSSRESDEEENIPAAYRFEYAVSDQGTDQFGHKESRQHKRAKGSYHVLLPDGRKQIVEYEADERGFKPKITYVDPPEGYNLEPTTRHEYSRPASGYDRNSQNYARNEDHQHKFTDRSLNDRDFVNYKEDDYKKSDRSSNDNDYKNSYSNVDYSQERNYDANDDYNVKYNAQMEINDYNVDRIAITEQYYDDFGNKSNVRGSLVKTGGIY